MSVRLTVLLSTYQWPQHLNAGAISLFTAVQNLLCLFILFSHLVIVPPHRILIHPHLPCDKALVRNLRMFPHISSNQLFLLADAVRDGVQVTALLDGFDLRFHLFNQSRQLRVPRFYPRAKVLRNR